MTDAELLTAFEFCRIGCGIHEGKLPRGWTMRKLRRIWCELRLREQMRLREIKRAGTKPGSVLRRV
jgi:hypothetical protein